ncbi:MAG: aldose 1-epimerase [Anaerolineae bacterium]|nr:aldose 1-epimerase [Anaerolineae bacterium]
MERLPYTVRRDVEDGYEVWVLEDAAARAAAWVVPDVGFNLCRLSVEPDGHEVAIIDPPPILADLRRDPCSFGMPVLFPFPGRIPGCSFAFRGHHYRLTPRKGPTPAGAGSASPVCIHGLVLDLPWQVTGHGADPEEGAIVTGHIESEAFPGLVGQYPSAFRLEMTYRLRGWMLTAEARVQNVGGEDLPAGYGLHPYLHAPIDHESSVGGCVIEVPATRRWELVEGVPTGRLLPLEEDVARGVSLEGRAFDEVYTGLLLSEGVSRCALSDTGARLATIVEADRSFRNWVVYTPPRPAVCLEPWTTIPNALNLTQQGIDTGLDVLHPGESRTWTVRIRVKRI